jgi:hypothetical protein
MVIPLLGLTWRRSRWTGWRSAQNAGCAAAWPAPRPRHLACAVRPGSAEGNLLIRSHGAKSRCSWVSSERAGQLCWTRQTCISCGQGQGAGTMRTRTGLPCTCSLYGSSTLIITPPTPFGYSTLVMNSVQGLQHKPDTAQRAPAQAHACAEPSNANLQFQLSARSPPHALQM